MIPKGFFGPQHVRWLNELAYFVKRFGRECKRLEPVACPTCSATMDGIFHTEHGYISLLFDPNDSEDGVMIGTKPRPKSGRLHSKRRFHWRCGDCGNIHTFAPVEVFPVGKVEFRIDPKAKVTGDAMTSLANLLIDINRNSDK
jgi:hypothetical protein